MTFDDVNSDARQDAGHDERLLVVGTGDLGTKVAMLAAHGVANVHMRILGRNEDRARRLSNMCRLSALQCGIESRIDFAVADLEDAANVRAELSRFRPDVVFTTASVQPWHGITQLPADTHKRVAGAGYGPWLAMHLAPVLHLMKAVRAADCDPVVVNAAFPDAVHPALAPLGLSPLAGIGNVANYIPGLRTLVAHAEGVPLDAVHVRFMAHHFVSFSVSKMGETRGAPYFLRVEVDGEDVSHRYDAADLFRRLSIEQPRTSGRDGQFMTAASAMSVLRPLLDGSTVRTHSPGLEGRIGGWPVIIADRKIQMDLPDGLSEAEVSEVNRAGQVFDGIREFLPDGTAIFTDAAVEVMQTELAYSRESLAPDEAPEAARELRMKFLDLLRRVS